MSEKSLLEKLDEFADPNFKWCCRDSTTGRGLRLHQTKSWKPNFDTPKEALENFIKEKEQKTEV